MPDTENELSSMWRLVGSTLIALSLALTPVPALSAENIRPEVEEILRAMSDYLGGLPAFTMNADVDNEIIDLDGQKLQLSSAANFAVERPNKLYVHREGVVSEVEFVFDGKTLTLYGKSAKAYAQIKGPTTIEDATRAIGFETGLDIPAADFLAADPYPELVENVGSSEYRGTAYVNGIECHYLSFRSGQVDWQLWVQTGDKPLPMKLVITSKWVAGAPQYAVRFRDWNTKAGIKAKRFRFPAPRGARKLDAVPVNVLGEMMSEGVQ